MVVEVSVVLVLDVTADSDGVVEEHCVRVWLRGPISVDAVALTDAR